MNVEEEAIRCKGKKVKLKNGEVVRGKKMKEEKKEK